jgi:uncharacterized membrane protein YhhN
VTVLIAAAAVFAAGDWIAVARGNKRLEYICKPATLAVLLAIAMTLQPHIEGRRTAFVVALAFSLAGDVFLMLPRDMFVAGLASFFVAHVAYIVGFRIGPSYTVSLVAGGLAVVVFVATIGRQVVAKVGEAEPKLVAPVSAYVGVISIMVMSAIGTHGALAASGAVAFMISDTLIAWNRFVRPLPWAPLAIMVTYHVAQALLVGSLRF